VAKDQIKEVAYDPGFFKGASDVINPAPSVIQPGLFGRITPVGPAPFAVVTQHQAPAAATPAPAPSDAVQLDAQLQSLAEALAGAEASRQALQQQYDETAALLKRALDEADRASGGST
jgi:hypothetical protein